MLESTPTGALEVTSGSVGHHHPHHHHSPISTELPKTSNMPLDMNIYSTRKTVAQGMMDIALMTANASQLKYVLLNAANHRYLEVTISLLTVSIILQIVVGIILIFLGRWNINYRGDQRRSDMANNAVVILIFLITVVNVMISSFGPNGQHSSDDKWKVYGPSFKSIPDSSKNQS
ncbi:Ninjurin-1-like protein [Leptotrombidium deliense]|uniref:Ninjurin-1-like protein n=1 Tax=Leptotrombidium deliense TaxID=299467 RepID=A0A443SJ14_9ACAR|nr:Ninjurin-1-like protein [Leptotrombidium deliense]